MVTVGVMGNEPQCVLDKSELLSVVVVCSVPASRAAQLAYVSAARSLHKYHRARSHRRDMITSKLHRPPCVRYHGGGVMHPSARPHPLYQYQAYTY